MLNSTPKRGQVEDYRWMHFLRLGMEMCRLLCTIVRERQDQSEGLLQHRTSLFHPVAASVGRNARQSLDHLWLQTQGKGEA